MLEKLFLSGNVISQFMQVLPISLLAAVVFVYVRRCSRKRRFSSVNKEREAVLAVFVCYLTGLLSLVWPPITSGRTSGFTCSTVIQAQRLVHCSNSNTA